MKKLIVLLAVCLMLFAGCTSPSLLGKPAVTPVPGVDSVLPNVNAPASLDRRESVSLYFRYLSEPFLAMETRSIIQSPSKPFELALLSELVSGPGTHASDLTSLFPTGVQVLSTVTQGRTLFVTLSGEILNPYPDESSLSPEERVLRRRLCLQSLVATVTDNCDIDQVQILVEQTDAATGSLRLTESFFQPSAQPGEVIPPLTRDDQLLLTPGRTMEVIFHLWQIRDWQRLYQYIALRDPVTRLERDSYRDFVAAMEALPLVTDFTSGSGSVTLAGDRATFALAATTLSGGRETPYPSSIVRLCRENGLWRVTLEQLTGWLED